MPPSTETIAETIAQALRQRMRGEVLVDEITLTRYATDMSMYEIRPLVVVVPQDVEDVVAVVWCLFLPSLPPWCCYLPANTPRTFLSLWWV